MNTENMKFLINNQKAMEALGNLTPEEVLYIHQAAIDRKPHEVDIIDAFTRLKPNNRQ